MSLMNVKTHVLSIETLVLYPKSVLCSYKVTQQPKEKAVTLVLD